LLLAPALIAYHLVLHTKAATLALFSFSQNFIAVKEHLLRELDMYQEIAVAKGAEYDHLNAKMDHCQESIETLSDEIQRLQGE
jgi:hypothetical protein